MKTILMLGNQAIQCRVQPSRLKANTYEGSFEEAITDECASEFWSDFEQAVNDVMLSVVDHLGERLAELPFFVLVDDRRFHASEVDLQIYPSTRGLSFTLSEG
ncbi:hypothetical protein [Labilithrix luteola]|uniref:hypothetical protein n=1 Tax=Labilithrix luteola TaxID=1391654 RepID=UPI0011BAD9FC|nr:hypothetical protein [Labilithrix luteola]